MSIGPARTAGVPRGPARARRTELLLAIDKQNAKTFDTCDSHVVPHRSTEQAQWCLTSEFGRDLVLSPWYERTMEKSISSSQ